MRDEPDDTPIPDAFQPSDYHVRALERARAKVEELKSMSKPAQWNYGAELKRQELASCQEGIKRAKKAQSRLLAMRKSVLAWAPPSSDHQGLKDFMLQQIDQTLKFDGDDYYVKMLAAANKRHPMEYFASAQRSALDSIAHHTKENQEEIARAASRTKWVQDLRTSLRAVSVP